MTCLHADNAYWMQLSLAVARSIVKQLALSALYITPSLDDQSLMSPLGRAGAGVSVYSLYQKVRVRECV